MVSVRVMVLLFMVIFGWGHSDRGHFDIVPFTQSGSFYYHYRAYNTVLLRSNTKMMCFMYYRDSCDGETSSNN